MVRPARVARGVVVVVVVVVSFRFVDASIHPSARVDAP